MIEDKIVELLIDKGYHIATSESCTGGLVCATLINVANASKVINESIVTYSNEAKMKYLKVNNKTIEKYGVVSEEVCYEMAKGICKQTNSEVGISVSGIAGPSGGSKEKPVGMVCFGICILDKVYTYTNYFKDMDRNEVRKASVQFVLAKLWTCLNYAE